MACGAVAEEMAEVHLCATVAYDGTDFCGFQLQTGQRTVQGVLEDALATITQESIRVVGAGRTDSGVHAWGQVVAFHTRWRHSIDDLHRALNAVLPVDVAVRSLNKTREGFHPRFDAKSRWYRYTVWNHVVRNPLLRRTALWLARPLDVEYIAMATRLLIGEHDFGTFGSPPQGQNTVRQVVRATWGQAGSELWLDIEANAFLYRMVRSIVGTLLQVGMGEMTVEEFDARFASADRDQAGPTAPANGLCLMAVAY
jgi:tRNA pseudouridine38-40 synthase